MKTSKNITTKSRLLDFLANNNVKKSNFYKSTGLGNGFLDKNDNINSDKIEIIASSYPCLNIEWLITGKGEMFKEKNDDIKDVDKNAMNMIAQQGEQIGELKAENKFKNEQIKKLEHENEHLKNQIEKLRNYITENANVPADVVK
jgi:peptidoglycan hydrolase CwlO-like protein